MPHCLGALDGKHVAIKRPKRSGSVYFNYKGFYSIVLLAVVDADYRFVYANVGAVGSSSDAGVFDRSDFAQALRNGRLHIPAPDPLILGHPPLPYFLVGDDAFALTTTLMKPYPMRGLNDEQRIFNGRLSRARRVVENAFGIVANR